MTSKQGYLIVGGFILLSGILGKLKIRIEILRFGHSQTPDRDIIVGIGIIVSTLIISKYFEIKNKQKEKKDEKHNNNASS